ncbi:hypothetical protein AVEN_161317-1 [Araneus ventricosus]|uniref:Uncharacterized protein n=1 Tax=Araneus ventricosus TaxID=182803 RepID=A0A4Y2X094_ARAVE|nr:hypothetical protein AVEN_161317-1 [Araneus ventricosus]
MKLKDSAVPSVFKTDDSVSKDYSLYRSQKRDIRSYLIDTQRRVAVKRFLDSFFDRRKVLTFLANLYNNPPVVGDKNKLKIQRMREVIRKLNRRNKKLNELYKYWKEISAAKTEMLKNTLTENQRQLYMSRK